MILEEHKVELEDRNENMWLLEKYIKREQVNWNMNVEVDLKELMSVL